LRKIARRKATQINHMQIQRTGKIQFDGSNPRSSVNAVSAEEMLQAAAIDLVAFMFEHQHALCLSREGHRGLDRARGGCLAVPGQHDRLGWNDDRFGRQQDGRR